MHVAVKERKVAKVITGLAITAVSAGWIMWLYHANQAGLQAWWDLTEAKVLLLGGVLATIAMFEGLHGVGNNVEKLVDLGDEVAGSGGPPSPEQAAVMQRLGAAIERSSKIDLALLFLAVACMATARYW